MHTCITACIQKSDFVCVYECVCSAKTNPARQPMSHNYSITRLIAMATIGRTLPLVNSVVMISELDVSVPPSQSHNISHQHHCCCCCPSVCVCVFARKKIHKRKKKTDKKWETEKTERAIVYLCGWNVEIEKDQMWEKEKNGEAWELRREIQSSHMNVQNVGMCVKGHRQCLFFPCVSFSHARTTKKQRLWGPAAMQCDDRVVWLPWLPSGGRTRRAAGAPSRLIGWRSTRAL